MSGIDDGNVILCDVCIDDVLVVILSWKTVMSCYSKWRVSQCINEVLMVSRLPPTLEAHIFPSFPGHFS